MTRRSLLVCKSVHHGNTQMVADRIGRILGAAVIDADVARLPPAGEFTLIGIGSGIYYGRFHRSIRDWVGGLTSGAGKGRRVFIFSTSGLPFLSKLYHLPLRKALRKKGFDVVGEFSCRGYDTFYPLWIVGGLNRKHPNEADLRRAEEFADRLRGQYGITSRSQPGKADSRWATSS